VLRLVYGEDETLRVPTKVEGRTSRRPPRSAKTIVEPLTASLVCLMVY
jgi:hypothetical protein